jgi:integrase
VTAVEPLIARRTPARRKARQLATTLRRERPDYAYLKELFRQLRVELGIVVPRTPKRLPYVPSEDEIRRYYETVWKTRKLADLVLIKTLLYTGVRVSELVAIRLDDVDFDRCQEAGDRRRAHPAILRSRQPQVIGDLFPIGDRRGPTGVRRSNAQVPRLTAAPRYFALGGANLNTTPS